MEILDFQSISAGCNFKEGDVKNKWIQWPLKRQKNGTQDLSHSHLKLNTL